MANTIAKNTREGNMQIFGKYPRYLTFYSEVSTVPTYGMNVRGLYYLYRYVMNNALQVPVCFVLLVRCLFLSSWDKTEYESAKQLHFKK